MKNIANINQLPDLCLRSIFSHLPLCDLLRIHLVCPYWEQLQSAVCATRKSVNILVGRDAISLLSERKFEIGNELSGTLFQTFGKPTLSFNNLEYDWLDLESAKRLSALLPNIVNTQFAIVNIFPSMHIGERSLNTKSVIIDQVNLLIKNWSHKIENLKLWFEFEYYNDDYNHSASEISILIESINSCRSLRHLTIDLRDLLKHVSEEPEMLDLKIISVLESFYFDTYRDVELIFEPLTQYGENNEKLIDLRLGCISFNDVILGEFFRKISDKLARKFTYFHEFRIEEINMRNSSTYSLVKNFCLTFSQIRVLTIRIRDDLGELYEFLSRVSTLSKLECLNLEFQTGNEQFNVGINYLCAIPNLPSIRTINIDACLHTHSQLSPIGNNWNRMFPNLRILHYDNTSAFCVECDIDFDVHFDENRNNNCLRQSLQAWKGCVNLETIYTGTEKKLWKLDEL